MISIASGTFGVLLSFVATQWLANNWNGLPRAEAIHLDGSVLIFAVGLIVSTSLLAGLLPAVSTTGTGILSALQDSSRSIGGSVSRSTLRKVLLTAEIALTVILLVAAVYSSRAFCVCAFQPGLRHRTRTHHEVRIARKTIRYPGESHCLPPVSSRARAQSAWGPRSRPRLHCARRGAGEAMTS